MSTVGLTKAQERALLQIRDGRHEAVSYKMRAELSKLGLVYFTGLEPITSARGHAALAAPRMTKAELCSLEGVEINGICFARAGEDRGWIERDNDHSPWRLTSAGRTALNNVRAAMGSPDWKENV